MSYYLEVYETENSFTLLEYTRVATFPELLAWFNERSGPGSGRALYNKGTRDGRPIGSVVTERGVLRSALGSIELTRIQWLFLTAASVGSISVSTQSHAQKPAFDHDFRAVPLSSSNQGSEATLILDSKTGDLWRVWLSPGFSNQLGGSGVTYIMRLHPGSSDNEVIERQGLGLPPIVSTQSSEHR